MDGVTLSESTAVGYLTSLYSQKGGATPPLLAAVSKQESNLQQFNSKGGYAYSPLWGQDGYWPTESHDNKYGNGSHIGLMQMPTNMADAYDWQQNATDGVTFFYEQTLKSKATYYESNLYQQCPKLPKFAPADIEKDALAFYGPGASSTLGGYWAAGANCSGWVENPANKTATSYVDGSEASVPGLVE